VFKNPSPAFLKVLAESGPVPGVEDRKRKAEVEDVGQRKRATAGWTGKPADMERLAAGIEQLPEPDLLPVVKLIWENQTPEMYIKSDVDRTCSDAAGIIVDGEFQFDLYTLGSSVLSQLWDYTRKKVEL
jgi:transcription initiation factor TFIID/TFIIF subunit